MAIMSMSGLDPDFGEGGGLFKELRARKQKLNETFEKKVELSFDEKKIGEGVSQFFATQLPAGKKIEGSKHPTAFAAVNAAFDEDDPRRELMPVVRDNYKALLRNKEYAGADANQLLDVAYQITAKGTPSRELEGATIEDDIHRHKYKSDTALFGGGNVAAAPGYDEWLQREKEKPIEDRQIGFGTGIAANLVLGLGARAAKKPVANFIGRSLLKVGVEGLGQTLIKVGPPQGKLLGAALAAAAMAIPETAAYNAVVKTDWYRAREDEPIKRELAGIAASVVGGSAAYKVGAKTGAAILKTAAEKELVSKSALSTFLKDQDAKAIIAIGKARREEKAARDVLSKTLETVPSDVERTAWFEALGKEEKQFFGKTTDEEFLKGKFRRANRNLQRQLLLKSPVEGQPFGWAGEANQGTIFKDPAKPTIRTIFDPRAGEKFQGGNILRAVEWDGEGYVPNMTRDLPTQAGYPRFEVFPGGQARETGTQLALPPGQQFGLPAGGPGQQMLPPSGWSVVSRVDNPSGGAGGGGIFRLSAKELPKKTVVGNTPEGQPIFGFSRKTQEKIFRSLDDEQAVLVTDQVLNGGKPLEEALEEMARTKALSGALKKTEDAIAVSKPKTTVLPPDEVIGYEGAEAAAEAGKAAKVLVLKQEVQAASAELAERAAAETSAVKASVNILREIGQGIAPKGKEALVLADDLVQKEWNEQARAILTYLGDKTRKAGVAIPEDRVAQLRAAKAKGVAKPVEPVKQVDPRTVAADLKGLDKSDEVSDFEILAKLGSRRTQKDVDDYLKYLNEVDPKTGELDYRKLEAEKLYKYLVKSGVPDNEIDSHKIMMAFKDHLRQANELLDAEVKAVADDLTEFGGAKLTDGTSFGSLIPLGAVGLTTVAAALGLAPTDAEASVVTEMFKGVKALPKAWIHTAKEAAAIKGIGHKEEVGMLKTLVKSMDENGLVAREVGTSKVLPPRAVVPNYVSLVKEMYGTLEAGVNTKAKGFAHGVERILSPYARGNVHYRVGANPAVHLAHMQASAGVNTTNAFQAFENIMRDVKGGNTAAREIIQEFAPLAEKYSGVVEAHNVWTTKVKQGEKAIAALEKSLGKKNIHPDDVASITRRKDALEAELAGFRKGLVESEPEFQQYLAEHDVLLKNAAQKYPSTRVFLAAEDTAEHEYYPWLKSLLTSEEKVAATHLKAMMKTYEESIVSQGMNVITERPYMHYSWHPSWKEASAAKYAERIGVELPITTVPFNRFHSRTLNARPLVPDAWHSIQSYVPMAEKTLGWNQFWNKKGKMGESWYHHMRSSTVQGNPKLRSMWNAIHDASIPARQTEVDKWANRYFQFEVFRLLGGSPSVAYKHLFKLTGTYASSGASEAAAHFGEAAGAITRQWKNDPLIRGIASKLGLKPGKEGKFYDDALRTYIHQAKRSNILDDYELLPPTQLSWLDNMVQNINHHAGFMTSGIEGLDRAHQFLTASSMAAKRGLTARDASYAIYDGILKNNFLGGVLNPAWAKSPTTRALMLFQTTAFKILERRLITGMQTGRALSEVMKSVKGTNWTYDKVLSEMKTLKDFMIKGEYEFKKGIITDALATQRDFLGQYSVRQAMREMIYGGIILGGGAAMGHDYSHHLFHLPFLGTNQNGEPLVGMSPLARAAWDTAHGKQFGGEASDFGPAGDFLNNWFRSQGPIPQMARKTMNIKADDIPEIYREEGFLPKEFRYFFAIPSTKEKE